MQKKLPYIMAMLLLGTIIMCMAFMAAPGAGSERKLEGAKLIYAAE